MKNPTLGDQELEIYRFVNEHAPIAGRDVAEQFAEQRGLARSTVLTVLERLRKKGYLARKKSAGIYLYTTKLDAAEVLHGLIGSFVEKTLGGSVSPVVAYLARTRELTDEELADLRQLVDELRTGREKRK